MWDEVYCPLKLATTFTSILPNYYSFSNVLRTLLAYICFLYCNTLHPNKKLFMCFFINFKYIFFLFFQVQRLDSMRSAFTELWAEEKLRMFFKGLSARLVQSAVFSFSIILGYETIKRIAINEQYRDRVRWWFNQYRLDVI